MEKCLVLLKLDMPSFADIYGGLPFPEQKQWRKHRVVVGTEGLGRREWEERRVGKLWPGLKINNNKIKNK